MKTEVRKVDSQGRVVLPHKWREKELKETDEVILFEDEGILKIIPKKKIDLTKFFDSIEFDDKLVDKLEEWSNFESTLKGKEYQF